MGMLLTEFRIAFLKNILQLLWRQWSQLGVAGNINNNAHTAIIDPEALLIFTLYFGRYDPRLFDEVIDWCITNGRWISIQRLKNMYRIYLSDNQIFNTNDHDAITNPSTFKQSFQAFASVMDDHDTKIRWKPLIKDSIEGSTSFFLDFDNKALPVFGTNEQHFQRFGIIRPAISLRNLSTPIPMETKACILLRLRALYGLTPRAELTAYLLSNRSGRLSDIARSTFYSIPAVHDSLSDLTNGGFINLIKRGVYAGEKDRWCSFFNIPVDEIPEWVNWYNIYTVLQISHSVLSELENTNISDYMLSSHLLKLYKIVNKQLIDTSVNNPFHGNIQIESIQETLPIKLDQIIKELLQ